MIMVWSGWGIQVPLYVVLAFFIAMFGLSPFHLASTLEMAAAVALTGALAGGAVYFTARHLESKPGRDFIDAATNQRFTVKPSAGSFFFIPTRYWAFIIPLLGFLIGGASYMNPSATLANPAGAEPPAASTAPATPT